MTTLRQFTLFAVVFCCVSGAIQAQQIPPQQETQAPTLADRAGRLIDVRTGKVSTNAYILVAKDRILRIADAAPAGVRVVDLSKYTVVPGLIDSHAHVFAAEGDLGSSQSASVARSRIHRHA